MAASGDARYGGASETLVQDEKLLEPIRIAALEAMGAIKPASSQHVLINLIVTTKGKPTSNALAEAAVRTLPRLYDAHKQLAELMMSDAYPIACAVRRVRTLAQGEGAMRLIALAKEGKLPPALKTEATTTLYAHPDRLVRSAGRRRAAAAQDGVRAQLASTGSVVPS